MKRTNHYEAAFEAWLRAQRLPYVAIDERRRALYPHAASLKSLDFIVSSTAGDRWLIDVKGREFPAGKQYFRNWSTRDDVRSLSHWEHLFGYDFTSLFVFAYNVVGRRAPLPEHQLFVFEGAIYGFVAATVRDYAWHARPISTRWQTIGMPTGNFRRLARPLHDFLITPDTHASSAASATPTRPTLHRPHPADYNETTTSIS